MAFSKLIKIEGLQNSIISKIIEYRLTYEKLWSADTGRSISGKMQGTLIGIFPKIVIKFGKLSDAEYSNLASVMNSAEIKVDYYDSEKSEMSGIKSFYSDSLADDVKSTYMRNPIHKSVTVTLVSNDKR